MLAVLVEPDITVALNKVKKITELGHMVEILSQQKYIEADESGERVGTQYRVIIYIFEKKPNLELLQLIVDGSICLVGAGLLGVSHIYANDDGMAQGLPISVTPPFFKGFDNNSFPLRGSYIVAKRITPAGNDIFHTHEQAKKLVPLLIGGLESFLMPGELEKLEQITEEDEIQMQERCYRKQKNENYANR